MTTQRTAPSAPQAASPPRSGSIASRAALFAQKNADQPVLRRSFVVTAPTTPVKQATPAPSPAKVIRKDDKSCGACGRTVYFMEQVCAFIGCSNDLTFRRPRLRVSSTIRPVFDALNVTLS